VRAYLGGQAIADSSAVRLVWEIPYYPAYYFPIDDVDLGALTPNGETTRSPSRGDATRYDITVGDSLARDAAYRHLDSPVHELRDLVAFEWSKMDAWFEEDEQVYVHPRDPYKRVDILASTRNVRVEIDGVTVAESSAARFLFETSLPTRYYIPATDVRLDLLKPSDTHTECPYKGVASYHSVEVNGRTHTDIAWYYPFPIRESEPIAGYVSFYNEKVDIFVDGEPTGRPSTIFS
jgi:uncharacterized protein (DUF427 family)